MRAVFIVRQGALYGVLLMLMSLTGVVAQTERPIISVDNVVNLSPIGELTGFTDAVNSLLFTSDSRFLIAGSEDTSLRVWDVVTQMPIQELFPHNSYIKSVALSPDGKRLATASWDRQIIIYDVADDGFITPLTTLAEFVGVLQQVAFITDDKIVFTVGDGAVVLAEINNPDDQKVAFVGALHITALAVTSDLIAVASGFPNQTIWLLNGQLEDQYRLVEDTPVTQAMGFMPMFDDAKNILFVGGGDVISVWEIPLVESSTYPTAPVTIIQVSDVETWHTDFAFSVAGDLLFASTYDGTISVYDIRQLPTKLELLMVLSNDWGIVDSAISPDGRLLATGHENGTIKLWGVAP